MTSKELERPGFEEIASKGFGHVPTMWLVRVSTVLQVKPMIPAIILIREKMVYRTLDVASTLNKMTDCSRIWIDSM